MSGVATPHTNRRVSATCASWGRAGWQHRKTSRSRSSGTTSSGCFVWFGEQLVHGGVLDGVLGPDQQRQLGAEGLVAADGVDATPLGRVVSQAAGLRGDAVLGPARPARRRRPPARTPRRGRGPGRRAPSRRPRGPTRGGARRRGPASTTLPVRHTAGRSTRPPLCTGRTSTPPPWRTTGLVPAMASAASRSGASMM